MNAQWKGIYTNLVAKTVFWLATEIVLNLVGLDDLANYGEFVFEREMMMNCNPVQVMLVCNA